MEVTLKVILASELDIMDAHRIIIERIHHIFKPLGGNNNPPIVAEFLSFKDKDIICQSNSKLNARNSKVFIREQFSMEIENNKHQIMPKR